MKKSRYSEEQIIGFLKQAEAGMLDMFLALTGAYARASLASNSTA